MCLLISTFKRLHESPEEEELEYYERPLKYEVEKLSDWMIMYSWQLPFVIGISILMKLIA